MLTAAVSRVATCWKLTNEQLGAVLGLSPATASRLRTGGFELDRSSKSFELGQYLVRLFRGLDALMGSDPTLRAFVDQRVVAAQCQYRSRWTAHRPDPLDQWPERGGELRR